MAKQRIYFVRYGLTKYPLVEDEGPYDSPLHPIDGYEHGIAIARRLAAMPHPPDVVYSSSLLRAVSTSQLIVHALGKTKNSIRVEDGLIEWLTPSLTVEPDGTRLQPRTIEQLVEMTFTEIDQDYKSINSIATDPNNVPYGAPCFFESEEYLMARTTVTMQRLLEHADGKNICIVSHTPCAQAMALYLENAASLEESKIGPWPLGGVTMFTKESDNSWKLDMYADTSHMPGEYKNGLKEWSLPCLTKPDIPLLSKPEESWTRKTRRFFGFSIRLPFRLASAEQVSPFNISNSKLKAAKLVASSACLLSKPEDSSGFDLPLTEKR